MRECGNRVNSKAPVLTPSEIHFCCARHNPNAKTFSPAGLLSPAPPPAEPGLHFASFISQIFFFLCHVLKTKEPAPGSGLEGWREGGREGSQKRLKLNLVMERSLFSLTRDRLLNTSNQLDKCKNLGGKIFSPRSDTFYMRGPPRWTTSPRGGKRD